MATLLRATVFAVVSLFVFVVCLCTTLGAARQEPTKDLPVSLDRVRQELAKPPPTGLKLEMPLPVAVATFKTSVEQRVYVLSLEEWLKKEFELIHQSRESSAAQERAEDP